MEMSSQLQATAALPQGRSPVRMEQKDVWASKPVWGVREEKNISPTGIRKADRPTHSVVATPTTLFQVLSTEYNVAKC
jgi:hypothetical protein